MAIAIDLPRAATGSEVTVVMSVAITNRGETFVDGQPASETELRAHARGALAKTPNLRAVILADKETSFRHVIRVMDLLKQAGVSQIAIGVQAPP